MIAAKGEGAILEDVDGNKYIEFLSVNSLGHCHPEIVKAIADQAARLVNTVGINQETIELAEAIKAVSPGRLKEGKLILNRSGTEICDYAVSLARSYARKRILLSFHDSFHGLTGNTLELTNLSQFRKGSALRISDSVYAPFPNCYRCAFGKNHDNCSLYCLEYLREIFDKIVNPEDIAALIIEPIQMDGGVNIAPDDYLPSLKKLCNECGILLIIDEVYSGFGKTGKFFAVDQWGVEPDILCLGKCMGGGLNLAAIVSRKEIFDSWALGSITMRPNVVSCAAALAHIRLLQQGNMLRNVLSVGNHILHVLREFMEKFDVIGDVRGKGLLIGAEIVEDRKTKNPGSEMAQSIRKEALKRGLIINTTGRHGQVLTISPSLTITTEQADAGLSILEKSLSAVVNQTE